MLLINVESLRLLPEVVAGGASDDGAWGSILCAVMRLDGVVLPACKGCIQSDWPP